MSVEENRKVIRRYFEEVWNSGDLSVLDEIVDPAYINHSPSTPGTVQGPDDLKPVISVLRRAFPDLRFTIEDEVYEGDKVAIRCTMHGTHLGGSVFGMAPTGNVIKVNQIQIDRIVNGKIVEHWKQTDDLGMMRQLGVMKE